MKKVLVTISRQYGTSAQNVGKKLAQLCGINYYDNDSMADLMSKEDSEYFKKSGESIKAEKDYLGYSVIVGLESVRYSTLNEKMFAAQSELMKSIADKESAVFVGRCADDVLAGYEGLVTVYLGAPLEYRIKNTMARDNLSEKEAKHLLKQMDKSRETYYRYYTDKVWGNRENYSICLDASKLSEDAMVAVIKAYIDNM